MFLAIILGSTLLAFAFSITFNIDSVVKAIIGLPFLSIGIALLGIAAIFLYMRLNEE
ncbi:MAG: hypothetical protein ACTSX9_08365 [Candidatus Njordarchaeales archaeon]